VTTSNVPKDGVVPDPDKDNVSDYSVVVDLDRHAVFGFWFETPTTGMTAAQTALPITEANATGIYFVARRKQSAIGESITAQLTPLRVQSPPWRTSFTRAATCRPQNGICTASRRAHCSRPACPRRARGGAWDRGPSRRDLTACCAVARASGSRREIAEPWREIGADPGGGTKISFALEFLLPSGDCPAPTGVKSKRRRSHG
jgi:hypothetical protein